MWDLYFHPSLHQNLTAKGCLYPLKGGQSVIYAGLFTHYNFHGLNHQNSVPLRLHLEHNGKYFRREGVFASVLSLRSKSKEMSSVAFLGEGGFFSNHKVGTGVV